MVSHDIAIAWRIYQKALAQGLGPRCRQRSPSKR